MDTSGWRCTEIISILALIVSIFSVAISFIALLWNMIRDIWLDRIKIDISGSTGQIYLYPGEKNGMFRSADSTFIPTKPVICFYITNMGRRPVSIVKIYGTLKRPVNGAVSWVLSTRNLPKILQPYEFVTENIDVDLERVFSWFKDSNISMIYAEDTKGKKWPMSKKNLKYLIKTTLLVANSKK